jgi:Lrp/AsnC family transcriptional regulator, leucine-responsive regulatory protein
MKSKQISLDRLDWKIVELLQSDARITNTDIGKKIGLSQPAVTARIQQLEAHGVIEGYSAKINLSLTGLHTSAWIRIRTTHAQIKQCLEAFASMPEVIEAYRITGEDCFAVRVVVTQMPQLEAAIDALAKLGAVSTSVVLASYPPKVIRAPEL